MTRQLPIVPIAAAEWNRFRERNKGRTQVGAGALKAFEQEGVLAMRSIFMISCAALALAACGRDDAADEANLVAADNLVITDDAMMDPAMNADANLATDPAMQNGMEQDLTTNDADANLANGL